MAGTFLNRWLKLTNLAGKSPPLGYVHLYVNVCSIEEEGFPGGGGCILYMLLEGGGKSNMTL